MPVYEFYCADCHTISPGRWAVHAQLTEASGLNPEPGIEEAISRLEAGEDPEQIEAELRDLVDGETPFTRQGVRSLRRKFTAPAHDDTLYTL